MTNPFTGRQAQALRVSDAVTLADLGWTPRLSSTESSATGQPARVTGVTRDRVDGLTPAGPVTLALPGHVSTGDIAVGDWVMFDPEAGRVVTLLERATLLQRRAAGPRAARQLIAANVDTLGIVTSCNDDFNEARLERYLALASAAGCLPLVIITKPDQSDVPDSYRHRAEALSPLVTALVLNAKDPDEIPRLHPWCRDGQTMALLGSSGVGKTTLSNALTGRRDPTQGISICASVEKSHSSRNDTDRVLDLIAEQGYEALTVAALAARAGVSKGGLYHRLIYYVSGQ